MTKKEMEQLIDERVSELNAEVDKKYEHRKEILIEEHRELVDALKQTVADKAKELGLKVDDYCFRNIAKSHVHTNDFNEILKKIAKEKSKIKEEAKELKRRLVIMGLRNREVASVLMEYLGMECK